MELIETKTYFCNLCQDKISYQKYDFFQLHGLQNCLECKDGVYVEKKYPSLSFERGEVDVNFLNPHFPKIFSDLNFSLDEKIDEILFTLLNALKLFCFFPLCEFLDSTQNSISIHNSIHSLIRPSFGNYLSIIFTLEKERTRIGLSETSQELLDLFLNINRIELFPSESVEKIRSLQKVNSVQIDNPIYSIVEFRNFRAHSKATDTQKEFYFIFSGVVVSQILRSIKKIEKEILSSIAQLPPTQPIFKFDPVTNDLYLYEKVKDTNNVIHMNAKGERKFNLCRYSDLIQYFEKKKLLFPLLVRSRTHVSAIQTRFLTFVQEHKKSITNSFHPKSYITRNDIESELSIFFQSQKKLLILGTKQGQGATTTLLKVSQYLNEKQPSVLYLNFEKEDKGFSLEEIVSKKLNLEASRWSLLSLQKVLQSLDYKVLIVLDHWDEYFQTSVKSSLAKLTSNLDSQQNLKLILQVSEPLAQEMDFIYKSEIPKSVYWDLAMQRYYLAFPDMNQNQIKAYIRKEIKARNISLPDYFYSSQFSQLNFIKNPKEIETFFFLLSVLGTDSKQIWNHPFQSFVSKITSTETDLQSLEIRDFLQFYIQNCLEGGSFEIDRLTFPESFDNPIQFLKEKRILAVGQKIKLNYSQLLEVWIESYAKTEKQRFIETISSTERLIHLFSHISFQNIYLKLLKNDPDIFRVLMESDNNHPFPKRNWQILLVQLAEDLRLFQELFHKLMQCFPAEESLEIGIEVAKELSYKQKQIQFPSRCFSFLKQKLDLSQPSTLNHYLYFKNILFDLNRKKDKAFRYFTKIERIVQSKPDFINSAMDISYYLAKFHPQNRQTDTSLKSLEAEITESRKNKIIRNPEIYWESLGFLIRSYENMGNFSKSLQILKTHRNILKQFFPERTLDLQEIKNDMARIYLKIGKYKQAEVLYHELLSFRIQEMGDKHPLVSSCYTNLAILEKFKGNYKKAIHLIEKDLESSIHYFGEKHKEVAKTYVNLGTFQALAKQKKKSIQCIQKGIFILEEVSLSYDPLLPRFYSLLANAHIMNSDLKSAKLCLKKALFHPATKKTDALISILNNTGSILEKEKNWNRAKTYYLRALAVARHFLPHDHIEIANVLNNLSITEKELGNKANALDSIEKSLRIKTKIYEKNHLNLIKGQLNYAEILIAFGEIPQGESILKIQQEICIDHSITDSSVLREMENLFLVLDRRGQE